MQLFNVNHDPTQPQPSSQPIVVTGFLGFLAIAAISRLKDGSRCNPPTRKGNTNLQPTAAKRNPQLEAGHAQNQGLCSGALCNTQAPPVDSNRLADRFGATECGGGTHLDESGMNTSARGAECPRSEGWQLWKQSPFPDRAAQPAETMQDQTSVA